VRSNQDIGFLEPVLVLCPGWLVAQGLFFKQDYLAAQEISNRTKLFYYFERSGQLVPGEDESYQLEIYPGKLN